MKPVKQEHPWSPALYRKHRRVEVAIKAAMMRQVAKQGPAVVGRVMVELAALCIGAAPDCVHAEAFAVFAAGVSQAQDKRREMEAKDTQRTGRKATKEAK